MGEFNQEFSSTASVAVNHTLNNNTPLVDVMVSGFDGEREKILPESIQVDDADNITVNFSSAQSGTVRVIG